MAQVENKVIPAPTRGIKATGVKTPEGRLALGLGDTLNEMARAEWHYMRSDILPSVARQGIAPSTTVYRSVLVFQRAAGREKPRRNAVFRQRSFPGAPNPGAQHAPNARVM